MGAPALALRLLPHRRAWLWVLLMASVALIVAFGAVVRRSVLAAASERQAQALLLEASWRCRALRLRVQRESCRCRSQAERPADSAGLRELVKATDAASPCAEGGDQTARGAP